MDQRISFVTLAVRDLDASRRFYVDGLGWTPELDVAGEVVMIRAGEHLVLSLWDAGHFEEEVGPIGRADGVPQVALAHNVAGRDDVDSVLAEARGAGAAVRPAEEREWGGYIGYLEDGTTRLFEHGYTGYFSDPDGVHWEIAYNPGEIGQMVLPD
jgi:catechol 2,3-dioxygenase-like lactoylglutathione lyase family enzyme